MLKPPYSVVIHYRNGKTSMVEGVNKPEYFHDADMFIIRSTDELCTRYVSMRNVNMISVTEVKVPDATT